MVEWLPPVKGALPNKIEGSPFSGFFIYLHVLLAARLSSVGKVFQLDSFICMSCSWQDYRVVNLALHWGSETAQAKVCIGTASQPLVQRSRCRSRTFDCTNKLQDRKLPEQPHDGVQMSSHSQEHGMRFTFVLQLLCLLSVWLLLRWVLKRTVVICVGEASLWNVTRTPSRAFAQGSVIAVRV